MFEKLKQASCELNQLQQHLKPNDSQSEPSSAAVEESKMLNQQTSIVCPDHLQAISSFCAQCRKFGCEFCEDDHQEHRSLDVEGAAKDIIRELKQNFSSEHSLEKLTVRKQKIEQILLEISGVVNKFSIYHEQMVLQHTKLAGDQIEEGKLQKHTLLNLKGLNSHNLKVVKLLQELKKIADREFEVEMTQYEEMKEHLKRKVEAEEPQDQIRES